MRPTGEELKVYVYRTPVDMRRGSKGLAALAQETMQVDPFSGALLIFVGRRYDTLKALYWERNGFALWSKKIENAEKFHWPRLFEEDVIHLSAQQLGWLLDGYDLWVQPHRMIKYSHVI